MSRGQYRLYGALLVISGIVIAVWWYTTVNSTWWEAPFILGLFIFLYYVAVWTQRWNIARQLRKIPDAHGPYTWVIDGEGIRITGALSNSASKWAAITKVRESQLDFFFYQAPRFARFLPKRVLTGEVQADLRRLITECVPGKAKLLKE